MSSLHSGQHILLMEQCSWAHFTWTQYTQEIQNDRYPPHLNTVSNRRSHQHNFLLNFLNDYLPTQAKHINFLLGHKPFQLFPSQALSVSCLHNSLTQYHNTTTATAKICHDYPPRDALWTVVKPSKPVTKPLNNSTHRKSETFESIILQNWKIFDFMAHHLAWLLHRTRWISRGFYTGSQAARTKLSTWNSGN